MDDIGYSGPLYNNKTHAIKVRTGDDILNAAKDAVCGELMVAKGGQFPGLYIATKTSGDDVELCRISEITPENKLPITNTYSIKTDGVDDRLSANTEAFNTGDFTISMWVKLPTINHRSDMLLVNQSTRDIVIRVRTDGFRFFLGGTTLAYGIGGATLTNKWYHLVWSHSGNTATPYIDGVVASHVPGTNATLSLSGLQDIFISGAYAGGFYDEVALFDSALSSSDVASIYNSGIPADISSLNPVNWWRMGDNDEGTGSTITDLGSGGNNATLINGPTFSTDVPFVNTCSVDFDGTNDYVDTGNKFDFMQQTLNFTVSAWIKFQNYTLARNQYILHTTDGGGRVGFMLWFDNRSGQDYLRSRINTSSSTSAYAQDVNAISDNNWHHVAVTCAQGGSIRLYVDGSQLNSSSAPSTTTATAMHNLIIGGALDTSGQIFLPFQGNIDEVGIFNTELSSSDITSIYNSGSPDDLSSFNPVGWWRMGDNDNGTGTTITDQGSGGNDGTLTNGPTFSTDVPNFNTYSLEFDGTNDYMEIGSSSLTDGLTTLTTSLWFNLSATQNANFFGNRISNGGINGQIYGNDLYFSISGDGSLQIDVGTTVATNTWHHLAFVFDGSQSASADKIKGYFNGTALTQVANTITGSSITSTTANLLVGSDTLVTNALFNGLIDEFALINSALSSSDITDIYNSGVPADLTSYSPIGWWRMGDNDGGTGTTITDQGSGGNNATLVNGPTFSTETPS